jgi:RNA polymerase-binding transcription factor DksA
LQDAGELSSEAHEASPVFSMHQADAASDSFDRDLAWSLLAFEQNALGEIDDALRRIRDGTYGVCELSGKTIPRRRLDAIPWARYTAPVQAQLEEQGVLPHAHLNGAAFVPRESNGS